MHVGFGPNSEIGKLFDHLVGAGEQLLGFNYSKNLRLAEWGSVLTLRSDIAITPPPGSPKSGHSALLFARSTVLLVGGSADWHIQQSVMEFAAM